MKSKYLFYILFIASTIILLYIYASPHLNLWTIADDAKTKEQSDFKFQLPELNLTIATSKRIGAEFYVMFFQNDTTINLSDSIDYVKYTTSDMGSINIIFDPNNKSAIFIDESNYLEKVNPVKFNIQVLSHSVFDSLFFEPRIKTDPLILKYPYIQLGMLSNTYTIFLKRDKDSYERIKDGDIYGGWNN